MRQQLRVWGAGCSSAEEEEGRLRHRTLPASPPPQNGYAVGDQLSIADIYLFDLLDLHRRKFGERVDALFPALAAHSARIAALPGVAAYLASDKRMAQ